MPIENRYNHFYADEYLYYRKGYLITEIESCFKDVDAQISILK